MKSKSIQFGIVSIVTLVIVLLLRNVGHESLPIIFIFYLPGALLCVLLGDLFGPRGFGDVYIYLGIFFQNIMIWLTLRSVAWCFRSEGAVGVGLRKPKTWLWLLFVLVLLGYYQIDYKRQFIESSDGSKVFTVWNRYFDYCYIIPGRYYLPYLPKENYIKTDGWKNYLYVVFKPRNGDKYALAIYQGFENVNFDKGVRLFKSQKSLEAFFGINAPEVSEESQLKKFEYVYVDMDEIYGIRIVRHEELIQAKKDYDEYWDKP